MSAGAARPSPGCGPDIHHPGRVPRGAAAALPAAPRIRTPHPPSANSPALNRCARTTFRRRHVVLKFQDQIPTCLDCVPLSRSVVLVVFQDYTPTSVTVGV